MKKPIRMFVGFDQVESEAFLVFCHSVLERASVPVSITPLCSRQLPLNRMRDPLQSNDFSFTRFLPPLLCGYEGWSMFVDCDFLCRWDIADLWHLRDPSKAVMVCQHPWEGEEGTKFLGATQTAYSRKCWSSLMLFNNEKCKALTPDYIDTAPGLDLHQLKWAADSEIGSLPLEWNHLVDVYPYDPGARMAHFTKGGPYFKDYFACNYSEEWFIAANKAFYTKQGTLQKAQG